MRRQQNGFVTLTVTLMLMILGTYGLYQSVEMSHYNVKRFQNVLSAKKSHWIAEGGLQCAFAVNQITVGDPQTRSYNACDDLVLGQSGDENRLTLAVTGQQIGTGSLYTLTSTVSEEKGPGQRKVAKEVKVENVSPMPGIFKTSSIFTLRGDFEFLPNHNDGECITMIVKDLNNFKHTDSTSNSKVIVQDGDGYSAEQLPTSVDLDAVNNTAKLTSAQTCRSGYQSFAKVGTVWPLAKDILEEPDMDMFNDFFGVPKSEWESVKNNGTFHVISPPKGESLIPDCAEQINTAFKNGDRSFWVEGSCYITSTSEEAGLKPFNLSTPAIPMPDTDSALIVVQDGAVFHNGQLGLSGLLYQFKTNDSKSTLVSADMVSSCYKASVCGDSFHETPFKNTAFYVAGSLHTFGGVAVDMEGMNFIANAGFKAQYNDKYWKDRLPTTINTIVQWQQGTWRDFQ
ncbi:hypothetical protein LRP52_49010 [Photobacterium sp. ZSDE20]|uniref:DUF4900 domain-containing protein n=1 Tax=Photobacterium pectinilyticum TaxID=2906793 RepID=A0ABT1NCG9_9GAMM|nr:hypothetical protein [Photobacterium sp. ZSDE20]MCQ1061361.1 hypothetical protein [Photobacterium sp. ZSDE20]MDD1830080.1 hypothetical protein [Photobacterium sp. ZSDE20]